MPRGAVTLGEIARKQVMLELACDKCGRFGRLRVAGLVERHGAAAGLPDLRAYLSRDCPHRQSASIYDRCQARFVALPGGR